MEHLYHLLGTWDKLGAVRGYMIDAFDRHKAKYANK
jgi:hypothetical protein